MDDKEKSDEAKVEFTEPSINAYDFQETINDNLLVKYQVLKMADSILIWIGSGTSAKFSDLSLSMKTPYDSMPVSSKILGHGKDTPSVSLASKLTKKLDKPVYVSFNIPVDKFVLPDIEKRLLEEVKQNPDAF